MYSKRRAPTRFVLVLNLMVVASLFLGGCGMSLADMPIIGNIVEPTPTFTATPVPTATNTPEPTPTPKPGETPLPPTPTPVPTPQVTIPQGFSPVADQERGYSLALGRGWTPLDLRGAQFKQLAGMAGMSGQLGPLDEFLASDAGQGLGTLYITDLSAAMFGGLPTVAGVYVMDAPGYTPDAAVGLIKGLLEANASMLGDVTVESVEAATVNGLPAVRAVATADLSGVGMNAQLFVKAVGLIANDKVYTLVLATPAQNRQAREPEFDQIIGTFRPE